MIDKVLGDIKTQYGADQLGGALDDQIRFIVDHVNAYNEGHDSATQAATALSKYAERSVLLSKLAGKDLTTGQLKALDDISGILVKVRGDPAELNAALAKFGGGDLDAGIRKLTALLADTLPGLQGVFDPSMYVHDAAGNATAIPGGAAGTPGPGVAGSGAAWSAFQARQKKERDELQRTFGAGAVVQLIVGEQNALQVELDQLQKEKAEDDRLAPTYRPQDFAEVRKLENEAIAIQTELQKLPNGTNGAVARDLRAKADNVQASLNRIKGYRPAGPSVLTAYQQWRDRRIASITMQMTANVSTVSTYVGLAQADASRLGLNPGTFLLGGPTLGLDGISATPNSNVVGADAIKPSAFDGLGKLWLQDLEANGTIKPGPPAPRITYKSDWSKIPDLSDTTYSVATNLDIRLLDYLQNADGSVTYSNRTGQQMTGRLVTKEEYDPVSNTTFKVTRIAVVKPQGASPFAAPADKGSGKVTFETNGTLNLLPFGGAQIYPGLFDSTGGIRFFSPGTILNPANPGSPVFTAPMPFFDGPMYVNPDGSISYPGLEVNGLGGGLSKSGSGTLILTPVTGGNAVGTGPSDGPSVGAPFGWGDNTIFIPDPKPSTALMDTPATAPKPPPPPPLLDIDFTDIGGSAPTPYGDLFFDNGPADLVVQIFFGIVDPMNVPSMQMQSRGWLSATWRTLADALHLQQPPRAARVSSTRTFGLPHSIDVTRQADDVAAGPAARPNLKAAFLSLGNATGEAFDAVVLNDGDRDMTVGGDGIVLESVAKGIQDRVKRQLQASLNAHSGKGQAVAHVSGYCLDYLKPPPEAGRLYRVASPETQAKFAPLRRVLQAAERLQQLGKLTPDIDPTQYFHQLRQWALWVKGQGFDASTFAKEFVDHARKNILAAKQPWTKAIADQVAALVPHRWQDISQVLAEAASGGH
jgi:hypothetical protein